MYVNNTVFLIGVLCIGLAQGWLWSSSSGSSDGSRSMGEKIADKAEDYLDSLKWNKDSPYGPGIGKNKCNWFVGDVIEEAGGSVPQIYSNQKSPISAWHWADKSFDKLISARCWTNVSRPQRGDVAGKTNMISSPHTAHTAIVTSSYQTIAASGTEGKVARTYWGFAAGTVYWRYTC